MTIKLDKTKLIYEIMTNTFNLIDLMAMDFIDTKIHSTIIKKKKLIILSIKLILFTIIA